MQLLYHPHPLLLYNVLLADVSMQLLNFIQLLKFPISPGAALARDKPQDLSLLYFTCTHTKIPLRTPLRDSAQEILCSWGIPWAGLGLSKVQSHWEWGEADFKDEQKLQTGGQRLLFFQPVTKYVTILRGVLAWHRRLSLALPILMRDNFPKTDCRKLQCLDLEGSGQWTADRNNLEAYWRGILLE